MSTPSEQQEPTGFRLSPQQELLFASGAIDPGFRAQCAVRVDGVDPARLHEALTSIVNRHEILRTSSCAPQGCKCRLRSSRIGSNPIGDWTRTGTRAAGVRRDAAR